MEIYTGGRSTLCILNLTQGELGDYYLVRAMNGSSDVSVFVGEGLLLVEFREVGWMRRFNGCLGVAN